MHFHIVTLFPTAFDSYLHESIIKRAIERKKIRVSFYNPRDYTPDKWRRVDRRPYGGGPGMVLEPESVVKAAVHAIGKKDPAKVRVLFFEPGGTQFDTEYAERASRTYKHIVMICGRYEGVDARVKEILNAEAVTIGPYTLTGGELHDESIEERRVAAHDVYTRPETLVWKKKRYTVPEVLRSGNHKEIDKWKHS
jgi:tRNA (guanine37-N1)-methyltransferase